VPDAFDDGSAACIIASRDRDPGALLREQQGRSFADPGSPARNESNFIVQSHMQVSTSLLLSSLVMTRLFVILRRAFFAPRRTYVTFLSATEAALGTVQDRPSEPALSLSKGP
jgi:hypothetical protein